MLVTQEALIVALVENRELRETLLLSPEKGQGDVYRKLMEELSALKTKNENLDNSADLRDKALDEKSSLNAKAAQEIVELKSQLESLTKTNSLNEHNLQYGAEAHRSRETLLQKN